MTINVSRDGEEIGQWSESEIREFVREGKLLETDFYWERGYERMGAPQKSNSSSSPAAIASK
jgi:hypothetical protein